MLQGSILVNAAGNVQRGTGRKRRYVSIKRTKKDVPIKNATQLPPIESLCDGSYFNPTRETDGSAADETEIDDNTFFCCNSKCNEEWGIEALSRSRSSLVPYGRGTQSARKEFVRESMDKDGQLHIRDGMTALAVCWNFYRALMGVSFNLLGSARALGSIHM